MSLSCGQRFEVCFLWPEAARNPLVLWSGSSFQHRGALPILLGPPPPLLLPQPSLPVGMSVIGGRKVQGETLGFVLYCWREASSAAGRGRRRKGPLESNSPWACVPQFSWEVGPVHSHPCQPLVVTALAPVTLPLCQLLRDLPAKGLPGLWHLS